MKIELKHSPLRIPAVKLVVKDGSGGDGEKGDKIKRKGMQDIFLKSVKVVIVLAMLVLVVVAVNTTIVNNSNDSSSNNNKNNGSNDKPSSSSTARRTTTTKVTTVAAPRTPAATSPTIHNLDQKHVVGRILSRKDFQTVKSKFCINNDHETSFEWFSQGDGTLPFGHVSGGIEKVVGEHIATILSAQTDKSKYMLDIGMNSGFFGVLSASLGFPVHAFDPQPACHALVKMSIMANGFDNNIMETFLMGLGDGGRGVNSTIDMHIHQCHGGYSWPDQWGKDDAAISVVKVPVHSLEEVLGNRHVLLMKMDTEGNEMSILKSGLDVFERGQVDYLIVETKPEVWKERSIDSTTMQRLEELAVSVILLENGSPKEKGAPFQGGNYFFSFIDEPYSQMKQVTYTEC